MKTNDNGNTRDMTSKEIKIMEAVQAEADAQAAADADRQALKEAALAKLGLTADEVAALFS